MTIAPGAPIEADDVLDAIAAATLTTTVQNRHTSLVQFTSLTYTNAVTSGSGNCELTFVAPTSGQVWLVYSAAADNDTATASTAIAPEVRAGATIGSGSVVFAASDNVCGRMRGTDEVTVTGQALLTGLTAGSTYNARLLHHIIAAGAGPVGSCYTRTLTAIPVG